MIFDKVHGKAILNNENKGMTSHHNNKSKRNKNKRCDSELAVASYRLNKQCSKASPDHFEKGR